MSFTLGTLEYGGYVNTATFTGGGLTNTGAMSPTGTIPQNGSANLIWVALAAATTTPTVTDSQGNTYSYTTTYSNTGVSNRIAYCINPSTASGMTVTATGTAVAAAGGICTGKRANPTPATDKNNGSTGSGATLVLGSITPTNNQSFLIATSALGTGTLVGDVPSDLSASGWTLLTVGFLSGTHQGIVTYYQVQKVSAAIGVTFGGTNVRYNAATIENFSE